jgi:hypothetical protein
VALQIQNSAQVFIVLSLLQTPNSTFSITLPSFTQQLYIATSLTLPEGRAGTAFVPSEQQHFLNHPVFPLSVVHLTALRSILLSFSVSLFVGVQ